ncbi:MAG: 50S ribosomal protein L25 [Firmicutes bacterium]|jgi:large subunit ribosomal protein L25|nr:50S ribosomal protein L25 [Bacillota bacterium]
MKQVEIGAELRDTGKGAARRLRRAGSLPAVLYGKGTPSIPLVLDAGAFERVAARDRNVLLRVRIPRGDAVEVRNAMIADVQMDVIRRRPIHVDLHQVNLEEKIRVKVPVHILGEESVSARGAILQHQLREIEVECLPTEVPDGIRVNVGSLGPGDHVYVRDLEAPEHVRILEDGDELVISVLAPRAEEEPVTPAAEEGPAEPELVKKPREEGEGR